MDDYSDGPSPFRLMGIMGMAAPMIGMILMSTMVWMGLLYVIARWRNNKAPIPDPQLGIKFAFQLFRYHGFQLLLLGGFFLLFSILQKGGGRDELYRPAFGFLVVGGLVFGVHTLLLTMTNQASFTLVARLFGGLNLLTTGVVGFVALIAAVQLLFAKGEGGNPARAMWSLVLVYVTAWAVQGALLAKSMLDNPAPDAGGGAGPTPPAAGVPDPMRQPLA